MTAENDVGATATSRATNKLNAIARAAHGVDNAIHQAAMAAAAAIAKLSNEKTAEFERGLTRRRLEFEVGQEVRIIPAMKDVFRAKDFGVGPHKVVEVQTIGGEADTGRGGRKWLKLKTSNGNTLSLTAASVEAA